MSVAPAGSGEAWDVVVDTVDGHGRLSIDLDRSLASVIDGGGQSLQAAFMGGEFYDVDRNLCGEAMVPVPAGSFNWRRQKAEFDVPKEAKLAMMELGLFGARGTIAFDDVRLQAREVAKLSTSGN